MFKYVISLYHVGNFVISIETKNRQELININCLFVKNVYRGYNYDW